ncbi:hypothetical protein K2X33_06445, partial [bacterium]|nr:hypothetical protein [bacterium]
VVGLLQLRYLLGGVSPFWYEIVTVAVMLGASVSGLVERRSFEHAWHAVGFSAAVSGLVVLIHDPGAPRDVVLYLSGMFPGWLVGGLVLRSLEPEHGPSGTSHFYGLRQSRPTASLVLFLSFLFVAGFPISPAFIGEDLILHHCAGSSLWVAGAISLGYVINGLTLARIYCHLCLGPPESVRQQKLALS